MRPDVSKNRLLHGSFWKSANPISYLVFDTQPIEKIGTARNTKFIVIPLNISVIKWSNVL